MMKKKRWIIPAMLTISVALIGCNAETPKNAGENNEKKADTVVQSSTVESEAIESEVVENEEKEILPLPHMTQAGDEMPDGIYHVSFDGTTDFVSEGDEIFLNLQFYEYDRYAVEDIEQLTENDKIQYMGEICEIKELSRSENESGAITFVQINGGFEEEAGFSLAFEEDENVFRSTQENGSYVLSAIGTGKIKVSKEISISDSTLLAGPDEELSEAEIGTYDDLESTLKEKACYENNTYATIQNNEVVDITVKWVP